jgi:Tol biopolymer transport system component
MRIELHVSGRERLPAAPTRLSGRRFVEGDLLLLRTLAASVLSLAVLGLISAPSVASAGPTGHEHGLLAWSRFDNFSDGTARIVVSQDGGRTVRAVSHPPVGSQDIDPKISPDGRWITFEHDDGNGATGRIVRADGTGERALDLGCDDPCIGVEAITWTPDGRHLVYGRVDGPIDPATGDAVSELLYTSGLHGGRQIRISVPGIEKHYGETRPSFAPDGSLVFLRLRNSNDGIAIFHADADGRHARQLTPWSLYADLPDASPAVRGPSAGLVVFETFGQNLPDGVGQAVATVPMDCRTVARCTRQIRYLTSPNSPPKQNFNPSWSPSGSRIVYCRFIGSDSGSSVGDIWTMRFDGGDKSPVSEDSRFEFRPTWGGDSS